VATAETDIKVEPDRVWDALVDPEQIKQYMFGSEVVTDWTPGHPIVWKGEYEGRSFEDKGTVLAVAPGERLSVTHFSPMSGQPDVPENYHTLTYQLRPASGGTHVTLTQDNNASDDELKHSTENWQAMLGFLKKHLEG
jgi:uncharacterized protein YndB with AHSA1/START domain